MPSYEVEHVCPLTSGQKDSLAEDITKIHTERFGAPSLFVNVRFTDTRDHVTYAGGVRVGFPFSFDRLLQPRSISLEM